jgi:cleavage and polyadenylation specificity factor subunit 3
MMRLKSKLLSLNASKADKDKVKIFSPKNCEELRIPFKADKTAKVVGKLAESNPPSAASHPDDARLITGVLVQNDFKLSMMAAEDLREFAGLTTTSITCRQRLALSTAGASLIKWALESAFGAVEEISEADDQKPHINGKAITNGTPSAAEVDDFKRQPATYLVMGCVVVRLGDEGEVVIEWEGNMLNDGIADAVMAVLLAAESSPAAVKRESKFPRPETLSITA